MTESEAVKYREGLAERLGAEWVARFDAIRPYLTYGESYDRGVRENWGTAVRMACHGGRDDEAEYWLGEMRRLLPPDVPVDGCHDA